MNKEEGVGGYQMLDFHTTGSRGLSRHLRPPPGPRNRGLEQWCIKPAPRSIPPFREGKGYYSQPGFRNSLCSGIWKSPNRTIPLRTVITRIAYIIYRNVEQQKGNDTSTRTMFLSNNIERLNGVDPRDRSHPLKTSHRKPHARTHTPSEAGQNGGPDKFPPPHGGTVIVPH